MGPDTVLFSTFLCALLWWRSNAEVFTAVTDCEPLLNTFKTVIDDLDGYILKEEKRLLALKRNLDAFKREHEIAMEDISNYLGNPINAFTLIKRLTTDLKEIEHKANLTTEFIRNMTNNKANAKFPVSEDLIGAAIALTRLQKTYKLQVNELAEGKINGVPYSFPMSASDCFVLGLVLFTNAEYKNSIEWMLKALSKHANNEEVEFYSFIEECTHTTVFTPVDVMDYISWAYYSSGDPQNASVWIKKVLAINPNRGHGRAQSNLHLFEKKIAEKKVEKQDQAKLDESYNDGLYPALCRGEYEPAPEITKRLTCFYLTKNHPFLRLAPIKAEQHYINPDVFVYYDVITDKEIEHVKALAKPMFQRASVIDPVTGERVHAQHRISKSAFLEDDDVISRISLRTTDFSGLSMDSAELLQVVNYGIGGHYAPHYDHARRTENNELITNKEGNRIATVLFYMSEVAQGGATAFMELGLSVFPVKNAALFWMNLHPSGEGDLSTLHAGCPVLRGSKWVSNKWIRVLGQEFNRPCSLEYQEEGIARQLPAPVLKSNTQNKI